MLSEGYSVMSDYLRPHGLQPARLLCPWDSAGKNTGVGSHFLLQGIFPIQGLNPCLLLAGRFFVIWATRGAPNVLIKYVFTRCRGGYQNLYLLVKSRAVSNIHFYFGILQHSFTKFFIDHVTWELKMNL